MPLSHSRFDKSNISISSRIYTLLALAWCAFAAAIINPAFIVAQEKVKAGLNFDDTKIAILLGPAIAIPAALATLPLGLLVDRRSRTAIIKLSAACQLFSAMLTVFGEDFVILLIARAVNSVALVSLSLASYSVLSDLFEVELRGRRLAWMEIGSRLGPACAFAAGGLLLGFFVGRADGWRISFALLSAPCLVACFLAWTISEPIRHERGSGKSDIRSSLAQIWLLGPTIFVILIGDLLAVIPEIALFTWGGAFFRRHFGMEPATFGWMVGMLLLVTAVAAPFMGGHLADRAHKIGGPRLTLIVMAVLTAVATPMALFTQIQNLYAAILLMCLYFLILAVISKIAATLLLVMVPNELRGSLLAIRQLVTVVIGVGLPPLIVSWLSGMLGGDAYIGGSLTLVGLGAGCLATIALCLGCLRLSAKPVKLEGREA